MHEEKKLVAGTLLRGEFIYPWVEKELMSSSYEPSFQYVGMVREDATDEEGIEMLENLALEFLQKFKQKRVHIVFGKEYHIIEGVE